MTSRSRKNHRTTAATTRLIASEGARGQGAGVRGQQGAASGGRKSPRAKLLGSLLKSLALATTTLTLSSSLLFAQEPLPITFRDNPGSIPAPISRTNVTFPSTS